jgi:GNAT superfamily N-acetyltransferase
MVVWKKFKVTGQKDLIDDVIASTKIPKDITIRPVIFANDFPVLHHTFMAEGDMMHPAYGMAPEDAENEITLIALKNDIPVAQISAEFEISDTPEASIDVYVNGMFVIEAERGKGIARVLGKMLTEIAEDWRQVQASQAGLALAGKVSVSGYTHPEGHGEAVIKSMAAHARGLSENF